MRRAALLCCVILLLPAPAYADGFGTYATRITGVRPVLAGVRVSAPSNGEQITVTNTGPIPLVIEGYQHEPYLKVTDHGVWENRLSPAVALNKLNVIEVPHDASATAAPVWVKLNPTDHAQWHDHRIHWMGTIDPPAVERDPRHPHLIKDWAIPVHQGATSAAIIGTLTYLPGSRWGTYLTYGAIGAALLAVLVLQVLILRRRRPEPQRPATRTPA